MEPNMNKKEYCTFWLRNGDCDFMQQGCLYKHELPRTPDEWVSIGFQHVPKWIKQSSPEWATRVSLTLKENLSKRASSRNFQHRRSHSERVSQTQSLSSGASNSYDISDALPSPLRICKGSSRRSEEVVDRSQTALATRAPAPASVPTVNKQDLLIDLDSMPTSGLAATLPPSGKSLDRDTLPSRQRPFSTPIASGARLVAPTNPRYYGDEHSSFTPPRSPDLPQTPPALQSHNRSTPQDPQPRQPSSVADINIAPPQHRSLFSPRPTQPTLTMPPRPNGAPSPLHTFEEIFDGENPKSTAYARDARKDKSGSAIKGGAMERLGHPAETLLEGLDASRHAEGTDRRRRSRKNLTKKPKKEKRRE